MFGFTRQAVARWVAAYRVGRKEALAATHAQGAVPKLTDKQKQWISKTLQSKSPRQLQFDFGLWTRELIRALIRKQFKVDLAVTSVGNLMRELGFTVQRPLTRAYQQNPDLIETWIKKTYPAIRKSAKKLGAAVFFADEAGMRTDYHSGTTWSRKGKTPVIETTGTRVRCNMLSAISPNGQMRFMVERGSVTTNVFIEFLRRLMHNAKGPIFLIVDGHPTHKAKKTKQFVESTKGMLRLYFLPPYAPELNPDELVWHQAKRHGLGREQIYDQDDLVQKAQSRLRSIQKRPSLVKSFFRAPTTMYATI
jgi:transposase